MAAGRATHALLSGELNSYSGLPLKAQCRPTQNDASARVGDRVHQGAARSGGDCVPVSSAAEATTERCEAGLVKCTAELRWLCIFDSIDAGMWCTIHQNRGTCAVIKTTRPTWSGNSSKPGKILHSWFKAASNAIHVLPMRQT